MVLNNGYITAEEERWNRMCTDPCGANKYDRPEGNYGSPRMVRVL